MTKDDQIDECAAALLKISEERLVLAREINQAERDIAEKRKRIASLNDQYKAWKERMNTLKSDSNALWTVEHDWQGLVHIKTALGDTLVSIEKHNGIRDQGGHHDPKVADRNARVIVETASAAMTDFQTRLEAGCELSGESAVEDVALDCFRSRFTSLRTTDMGMTERDWESLEHGFARESKRRAVMAGMIVESDGGTPSPLP
jgi:hypothetical protein